MSRSNILKKKICRKETTKVGHVCQEKTRMSLLGFVIMF